MSDYQENQKKMKKPFYFSAIVIVALFAGQLLFTGCYYDKEELLYPGSNICDSGVVTYTSKVQYILSTNCYSCHAGGFPSGGIKLDTYNDAKANAARMYGAVSHSSGFQPMPQNMPKLSNCNIQAIKTWLDTGTPQ
jgi:uncharacterized membrane protein